jgi:hypothetical protein
MKALPKALAMAGAAALLLGGVAFASVGNDHTGANSDNNTSVSLRNHASVTNNNDADIWNHIQGWSKSGGNKADRNTGDGSVSTGAASGTVTITNSANSNTASVSAPSDMDNVSVTNSTTGADSHNDAWVKVRNSVEVVNNNDGDVHNRLTLSSNSGENKATENTGDGSVDAGSASLTLTVSNTLNTNSVTVH